MPTATITALPTRARITKRVTTTLGEARRYTPLFGSEVFVHEVDVLWAHVDGGWRVESLAYVASAPKKDGTPSARYHTVQIHTARGGEVVLAAFPDAATPPATRVTLTIEGEDA